jgi:histidinol-phosphate/aromatic aminotransferase/cobyric acid decarboxylase-like protein
MAWQRERLEWPAGSPEPEQRRLLRRLRLRLAGGGELVIGHAPGAADEERIAALARRSGFAVERAGGELLAHPLPMPPQALAVASWGTPPGVRLDLRYANDEAPLLDPDPAAIWERVVTVAGHGGAAVAAGYPTDDPYGGERGAGAVARFFGVPLAAEQVTFAAGVTSLLHDLAGLADGGPVAAPELTHPDLAAWAVAQGCAVRLLGGAATRERLLTFLEEERPALLYFDRPDFLGRFLPLPELAEVVREAARAGATVLVDESPAPYLGPAESAARLVNETGNLAVLRGFTKAYSLGGMRAAFAVASAALAPQVRELVAPMQASELSLLAALALLEAGDVFSRLRDRVRAAKPAAVRLLRGAGLEVLDTREPLPWVGVADPGGAASALLESRGIRALRPAPPPVYPAPRLDALRLTLPLSDSRIALFRRLLAGTALEGDHAQP